jgi:DNA-binding NtrC family response regulator
MALILSINEEKDALALTERLLTAEGHRVLSFGKVQEAVGWLGDHQPDFVLVSGGRHGKKARIEVDLLKQAGLPSEKIVLLIGRGSLLPARRAFEQEVYLVISEVPDNEDELKRIATEMGSFFSYGQPKIKNENLFLMTKEEQ